MAEDTRWQERDPTTDAELYDMLRWAFGFGLYDEYATNDEPYFRYRMTEIRKVKAARAKQQLSIAQVVEVARYCHRTGLSVRWTNQLFRHLAEARADARERERQTVGLEADVAEAIRCEHSLADNNSAGWISRLSRAQGQYREEVLAEWQQSRNSSATKTA